MTDCSHFEIRNWREFQHYKDRNPPWIKLHYSLLASEDWVMLADASRVLAVACMLVASQNDGKVPNNPEYLKRVAYLNGENSPDFKPLIRCGFLIPLADASTLQADASKTLASARPETEAYREETETEESREDNAQFDNRGNGHYAFEGQVIKITKAQLDDWSFTFDRINVEGQLQSYDAYLTSELENDPTIRKKWFMRTAQILAKRDQDARNSTSAQKEANGQATTYDDDFPPEPDPERDRRIDRLASLKAWDELGRPNPWPGELGPDPMTAEGRREYDEQMLGDFGL